MTDKKMWADLRAALSRQGYRFAGTKNSHDKVYDAQGNLVTILQRSQSGRRSYLNKISELRRKGIAL